MKILLSVDDSIYSEAAVDVVLARTWPTNSSFKVISVLDESETGRLKSIEQVTHDIPKPGSLAAVDQLLKQITARLKRKYPQAQVSHEIFYGNSKEKILDCVSDWQADLVAVGSHGRTGLTRILLGSVSQTLLLYSDCSTLIVRLPQSELLQSNLSRPPERVLIPLDASEHSRRALDWVAALSWAESCQFKILTVLQPLVDKFSDGLDLLQGEGLSSKRVSKRQTAEKLIDESYLRMVAKFGRQRVSSGVLEGDVSDTILRTASSWPACLIVMGTRGHGGFKRLWLGSISQEIVLQAPCPVEVVKQGLV